MATTLASAASSGEGNRAAYARSTDTGNGAKNLRLDEATLSAFDLLLELPIFDSEIIVSDQEPADEVPNDDSKTPDDSLNPDDTNVNPQAIAIPIAKLPGESLVVESDRVAPVERAVDREPIRSLSKPPVIEKQRDETAAPIVESSEQSTAKDARHSSKTLEPATKNESALASTDLQAADEIVAVPHFESIVREREEPEDVTPIKLEAPHREGKVSLSESRPTNKDSKVSNVARSAERSKVSNEARYAERAIVSNESRPRDKPRSQKAEQESSKKLQTSPSSINRRSERLAEAKRGGRSNEDHDQHDKIDVSDQEGSLEILDESVVKDEATDPSQLIPQPAPLPGTNASAELFRSEIDPTTTPVELALPAIKGVASAIRTTTLAGNDNGQVSIASGIDSLQSSPSVLQNSSSRRAAVLPSGSSTLSSYQENRVLQRVLTGLGQLNEGSGQVRLRLHPPELGSLQVTLRVEAQQVSAMIEVEHPAARDVLLSNLPDLRSRLADQGMNISSFDVQVVDSSQWSQGSSLSWESSNNQGTGQNEADTNRSSRYLDRLRNQLDPVPADEATRPLQSMWTRKNGQLDVRF